MKLINCIIVDDEPQARKMMEAFVSQIRGWTILRVCSNAIEAFEALQTFNVDVIFLDIKMPIITGIDFLKSLKNPPLVIFTTAYNKYAMDGYELNVVDYLLKPISMHRLLQAAEKVAERMESKQVQSPVEQRPELSYMFVKHENKLIKINFSDIRYIEGMQNFVHIHLPEKSYLITQTMKSLEDLLPASSFTRVQKSYIVSMEAITAVFGNTIEIGTIQIPIGSNYKAEFMSRIDK
ncbi:response regulator transcription factor [Pedobacter gandavensis]|uniref:LytR/AlgR family response regulator transcription factor n=1 Tax=Pedobacter gandavensis TaxID=2679963 RepID=UPI002930AABB|nr:response regulator transcription factor [Pedobacter gandavensis]